MASEASQNFFLDFDVSNQPISWVWVTLLETDYFFHCAIEQVYFFSQNQSKEIFFQNSPAPPPPEYQMDRA